MAPRKLGVFTPEEREAARRKAAETRKLKAQNPEVFNLSLSPLRAIREKCVDCSGGSREEVRVCPVRSCALWRFRHGRRPKDI